MILQPKKDLLKMRPWPEVHTGNTLRESLFVFYSGGKSKAVVLHSEVNRSEQSLTPVTVTTVTF